MNKRGQGLPLTTVIIAILVILVLVIVVIFFLGGMRGVTEKISGIFSKTVAGSDLNFAIQSCQNYCDQAKLLPTKTLKIKSAYCTTHFSIDDDNDGEAQYTYEGDTKVYYEYYCPVKNPSGIKRYLSVPCDLGEEKKEGVTEPVRIECP